uniref:Growth factor receptor domain-containing protein n=1 Tax=Hippocampus comes TaxID=109280 RepID=A0A3Q3DEJ5_HIPCM
MLTRPHSCVKIAHQTARPAWAPAITVSTVPKAALSSIFTRGECHQTCVSCSGPNPDQCTQCERGLVLDPNSLLCGVTGDSDCPPRTFLHDDQFTCMGCHRHCYSCEGLASDECLMCAVPRYLHSEFPMKFFISNYLSFLQRVCVCCLPDRTCVSECPAGTYTSGLEADGTQLGFCLPCDHMCDTCTGSSPRDCLTCSPKYLRLLHLCVRHCPTGYDAECQLIGTISLTLYGATCEPCDSSCKHCSGPRSDHCLTCHQDFGLHAVESRCARCCQVGGNRTDCCICDSRSGAVYNTSCHKPG